MNKRKVLLPYTMFDESAAVMHNDQLAEQIVEISALLADLHETEDGKPEGAIVSRADVARWRGAELHLAAYGLALCDEWEKRSLTPHSYAEVMDWHYECAKSNLDDERYSMAQPAWIRSGASRAADRKLLFQKNPDHYITSFSANGTTAQ